MTAGSAAGLSPDPWLAGVLEREAYRLDLPGDPAGDGALAAELAALSRHELFVYAKVGVAEEAAARRLQDLGLRLADTSVILDRPSVRQAPPPGSPPPAGCEVRLAEAADEEGVVRVARTSFIYSRFHRDPRIPRALADAVKAAWAGNYFRGERGDAMVVAVVGGAVAGFLQILLEDSLTIDLIAVAAGYRRRGIAAAMLGFAEAELAAGRPLRVGTQLANVPSIRLYESLGFRTAEAGYVFHYHS